MKKPKFSEKNLKVSAGLPPEARKSPFWKRVLELLSVPSRKRQGVNISRIAAYAKEGQTVVVPDKVLGAGGLKSRLTVAALGFSQSGRKAIEAAGGKAISIIEAAKQSPTGKDAIIIK
ncbi:MAG: 50S ribosomal protein L18e [Candidatus Micrarchaeota archaeon]|nr:50S ribosomal protein L18e [Candidatus Micrarchaeota archaeon]